MNPGSAAVLVACAHGTRNPTGRRLIAELALSARVLRPGLTTLAASAALVAGVGVGRLTVGTDPPPQETIMATDLAEVDGTAARGVVVDGCGPVLGSGWRLEPAAIASARADTIRRLSSALSAAMSRRCAGSRPRPSFKRRCTPLMV